MKNNASLIGKRSSFYAVVMLILLIGGCVTPSSKSVSKTQQSPASRKSCKSAGPEFDCAASSLYGLCSKSGINLSYDRCLRLLPRSPKGNNMLEFKKVLEQLRFNVIAEKFTADELADINTPCVLLLYPPGNGTAGQSSNPLGHYIVLWPEEDKFEIIDYPRPTSILKKEYFIKHLQTVGINDIPALLCFRK